MDSSSPAPSSLSPGTTPAAAGPDTSGEPPCKRRRFRIQSVFGAARPWRSRKSRPCDTCRRRKTACIITTVPPCLFCKGRGLECVAADDATPPIRRSLGTGARSDSTGPEWDAEDEPAESETEAAPSAASAYLASENRNEKDRRDNPSPNDIRLPPDNRLPATLAAPDLRPPSCPASILTDSSIRHDGPSYSDTQVPPDGLTLSIVEPDLRSPAFPHGILTDSVSPSVGTVAPDLQSPDFSRGALFQVQTNPPYDPNNTTDDDHYETLEDGPSLTAHSMGPSAEQDTHLLASFRSVIMNETNRIDADILQVFPGDPSLPTIKPPVHFSLIHDEFPDHDNAGKRAASDAIESLVCPYGPTLVRLFFAYVHPVYPVVSKGRFLRAYKDDKLSLPASLRGAVYALASEFWRHAPLQKGPFPFPQWALINHAYASLDREMDAPNLARLQAALLLLHDRPAENGTIESPKIWMNAARAVACAQMIGLHREPTEWNLAGWEKSLRRKLWWAVVGVDGWSAVAHGNPLHIYPGSYSTGPLTMEDLRFDEDIDPDLHPLVADCDTKFSLSTGARFIESVRLSLMTRDLLHRHFSEPPSHPSPDVLLSLQTRLTDWHSLLPQCLTTQPIGFVTSCRSNGPLHLSYYATQALTFRALMSPATMAAKATPTSALRQHFPSAVAIFGSFAAFISQLTRDDLMSFWGRHARSQLILCSNFLIYLFLLASDSGQVKSTFRLLELFHEGLQRLGGVAGVECVGLIRPAALRIDSFFTQAAVVMRKGSRTATSNGGGGE